MASSKRSRGSRTGIVPEKRVIPESEIVGQAIKTDAAISLDIDEEFQVPDVGQDRRALRDMGALEPEGDEMIAGDTDDGSNQTAPAPDDATDEDWARLSPFERRLLRVVETLAARNQSVSDPRLADALENLAKAQLKGSKMIADEQRRTVRPSNEIVPKRSVFNPRGVIGYVKPVLKCRFQLPWEADDDSLTREEVELLNLIEPGVYKVHMLDKRVVTLYVKTVLDVYDKPSMVTFKWDTALGEPENMRRVPAGADLYREILKQSPKTNTAGRKVMTMEEEEAIVAAEMQIEAEGAVA